jgi:hypothetical protein
MRRGGLQRISTVTSALAAAAVSAVILAAAVSLTGEEKVI